MSGLVSALVLATTAFVVARLTGEQDTMSFYTCAFAMGAYMVACDIRAEARRARDAK